MTVTIHRPVGILQRVGGGGRVQSGLDWMTDVLWFDVVQGKSDRRAPGERLRCGLANICWDLGPIITTRLRHREIPLNGHFPEAT